MITTEALNGFIKNFSDFAERKRIKKERIAAAERRYIAELKKRTEYWIRHEGSLEEKQKYKEFEKICDNLTFLNEKKRA